MGNNFIDKRDFTSLSSVMQKQWIDISKNRNKVAENRKEEINKNWNTKERERDYLEEKSVILQERIHTLIW